MRVALYLRVSTSEQTTDNQRRELMAVAEARGWSIANVFEDAGVSGAKSRDKRPAFDAMLKEAVRGQFDIVAAWSVDRLGRSLPDLIGMLNDLHASGVQLYLHQQALDTTTPSGRALFGMLGVFAEFERSMIQERVKAGLARARAAGRIGGRRTVLTDTQRAGILAALDLGHSLRDIGAEFGVSQTTVARIRDERTT